MAKTPPIASLLLLSLSLSVTQISHAISLASPSKNTAVLQPSSSASLIVTDRHNNSRNTVSDGNDLDDSEDDAADGAMLFDELDQSNNTSPLRRCTYDFTLKFIDDLYTIDNVHVQTHDMTFTVLSSQSRCYLTRQDLQSRLEQFSTGPAVVGNIWFVCQDPGTEIVFLENDMEADPLSTPQPAAEGFSGYYGDYISYFKIRNCRFNLKGMEMVANMTDLRVVILMGEEVSKTFAELTHRPDFCTAFENLAALGILHDWSTQNYLHLLALCAGKLDKMVEVVFTNDSLTSFPPVLETAMPNLRALMMTDNNLTSPVEFPWRAGYAKLPRNLTRSHKFNVLYTFDEILDIQPDLFRRVYLLDNNDIRNLTTFQLHGEFQYVSFEKNKLTEIADFVFGNVTDLQFLSLAQNELKSLPGNLFARLTDLKRLDLQKNELRYISAKLFRHLRNLERLNLAQNRLVTLQDHLFSSLERLTDLILSNNSIANISQGAISPLSVKLRSLDLQNNPLREIPVVVFLLRSLERVNFDHTGIEVLDFVEIDQRTDVLYLSRALVNPSSGNYATLEDNPKYQKIISLRHSKLRSMVFYNSTSETLETFLFVVKFYTIYIEGSPLACDSNILNVTHEIQTWTSKGILTGNEPSLRQWTCAWPTELQGQPIADLKDEETYSLLEPSGSGSSVCPEECACYVRTGIATVIVDCRERGLTSLPSSVPPNTRELWLQNNTIKALDKLPYLQHLHDLKLSSNNVQELPEDLLVFMGDLQLLYVDDNWLTRLSPHLGNVKRIRLAGNPFRCDCSTLWMKNWLLAHQRTVLDWFDMKCSTEGKEGRVFTAVPDDQFVCKTSPSLQQLAVPIAIPLTFFVLLLALCVVAFLMRRRLKVLLYIHTGLHPFDRDPPGDLTAFDVTVCCDVAARDWVLKNIVQPLEGGKFKTFFYNRDAFLGLATQENVRYCVENSRRLVVVLGSRWDGNDLLVNATREALSKCRKDMVHFMTVVVHQFSAKEIDNKDIKQYISKHRYINTEDKHFFKKLLYEMPAVRTSECQRKKDSEKQLVKVANGQIAVTVNDIELTTEYGPNHKKCKGLGYSGDVRRHNGASVCIGNGSVQATGKEDRQQGTYRRERATKTQGSDGEGGKDPRLYAELGAESEEETAGTDARNRNEPQNRVRAALGMNGNVKPKAQLVFVWYADADLPFTLKAIVEPLESLGHKCVLQDRDFSVGAPIQENIVLAAETCARSVFVLSNETARNEWFTFAFHVTFDRHLQSKDHRMVLVMREDVDIARFVQEVQQVISTSAVLSDDDPWFERRLIEFMTRHDEVVPEHQQV